MPKGIAGSTMYPIVGLSWETSRINFPQLTEKPQVVVIDPPRAGMHKNVIHQILGLAPERIVYVSCNPASLARDAAMLSEAYDLLEVQPVDMFPHTYHIEAVAKLVRRQRTGDRIQETE